MPWKQLGINTRHSQVPERRGTAGAAGKMHIWIKAHSPRKERPASPTRTLLEQQLALMAQEHEQVKGLGAWESCGGGHWTGGVVGYVVAVDVEGAVSCWVPGLGCGG